MPKLPRLRLTTHAQMRMVERTIDIDNAKRAIAEPDERKADPYGKIRVIKKIGGRTVVVVYSDEKFKDRKNEYLVITFYYLDK
ncbi:MAG: DUF4258 domain-containing protein [Patescibacteria group bacterium]|nr:DUF4258 domain-containing protein [Patescibacteria group bacterium]